MASRSTRRALVGSILKQHRAIGYQKQARKSAGIQTHFAGYLSSLNEEARAKQRKSRLIRHAKRHAERDPKLASLLKKIGIR